MPNKRHEARGTRSVGRLRPTMSRHMHMHAWVVAVAETPVRSRAHAAPPQEALRAQGASNAHC